MSVQFAFVELICNFALRNERATKPQVPSFRVLQDKNSRIMVLHSTKGISPKVTLAQGVANGLAPDGGLYMPDRLPKLPLALFNNITEMTLREIAYVVCDTLFGDEIPSASLKKVVDESLNFDMPLVHIADNRFVLELFHGPTYSFKDVGARFMARLLPALNVKTPGFGHNIIVATSGDSGGAVANGFQRSAATNVFVVFPSQGLEHEHISQFASLRNVKAIEVAGTFDDCQALVKQALADKEINEAVPLTSGNSINLARQLPAIIYYFYAYARAMGERPGSKVVISVPCGNLGNLSAALMAKRMGLPVERFIAANNANDVFVEYLKTGGLHPRKSLMTIASAMDVGNPSNIARIIDLYEGDLSRLRRDVEGVAYNDREIADTMIRNNRERGYLIGPQGATALRALEECLMPGETGVALACASPVKFRECVESVNGIELKIPQDLRALYNRTHRITRIPPKLSALRRVLLQGNEK